MRVISPPPGFDLRNLQLVAKSLYRLSYPGPICSLGWYIQDIIVVRKMHGIEHFKQFSHVEAVGTNLYFKCPQSPVIYRRVACVIHQAHSLCLPETSRCIGEHCGLHWSTTCFYMVHTENTVSTTKCHRKFLFLTSLPNRTTIYNYVKRFRATGSISDNITRGGYVLEKNCARQEDRGRPRRTDCTRTASERLHRLQPNSHLA